MADQNANSYAFVQTETIPPSPPPVREAGIVKWGRENLFSNIPNTILTLVSLYFLYLILAILVPWLLNGVWTTSSLSQCREVLNGKTGACFSVLTERWNQLLYGFQYPAEQYWRPNLALVLLFIAIAPVLFFDLPRKMLIFTAIYPFLAFWLIWGGTILTPLIALLGLVAGGAVFQIYGKGSFAIGFFGGIVAAFVIWIGGGALIPEGASDNAMLSAVPSRDLGGLHAQPDARGDLCVSVATAGHRAGSGASIAYAADQVGFDRLHRIRARRAPDHAAVRGIGDAGLLLPT